MHEILRARGWRALFSTLVIPLLLVCSACSSDDANGAGDGSAAAQATNGDEESDAKAAGEDAATSEESTEDGDQRRKPRERTTSVDVSEAFQGDLVVPVIAEGTIRARYSAEIRTEIAGRLDRVYVEEGQSVTEGTLLAKLDDREYEVAAEEARSQYFRALSLLAIEEEALDVPYKPAEAIMEQVKALERMEEAGTITREERLAREIQIDVDALKDGYYRLEILSARSGIAAARAALERAKLGLERTEIRAPFSGVVTGLVISNGEQVMMSEALCTLVNNRDIEAEVGVLESDIGAISVGRRALLSVPALNDTLAVTVDVISPEFDRDSRTCEVLLRVNNSDGRLRPGMFVRAIISGERYTDRLLVPKEAVITRDARPLLFKVEDNRAKWLYLSLGEQNGQLVEVTRVLQGGTLKAGDQVIINNHLTLAHEAKVKVKKVRPTRDPWATTEASRTP